MIDLKSPFFWDMASYHWMMDARRFETTYWFYFQESKCPRKLALTSSPLHFIEGTGTSHPVTKRHVSEGRRSPYKTTCIKRNLSYRCTRFLSCNCSCLGTALKLDYIRQTGVTIDPYVVLYCRYAKVL